MYENLVDLNQSGYQKFEQDMQVKSDIIINSLVVKNSTHLEKAHRRDLKTEFSKKQENARPNSHTRNNRRIELNPNVRPYSPRRLLNPSRSRSISK